ncbi:DUF481 domain-containing protein [Reichenbachiella sp. 5M10]|uniref:DUF481 domain-containing protein n=1 Tax=Reichenbachiella sp. 5M10 TaxID=1889772 RepID=UPI0011799533|nr:DUF481 domain-containing protein [Reichenbachiella sp. 5M10]
MNNNQVLIGEIKSMEYGILTVETDYSDSDFTVEWDKVKGLKTSSSFIIILTTKYRLKGTISHDMYNSEYLIITPVEGSKLFARIKDIVYLKSSENRFWDRISASVDGGYTITKSSNTNQLTINGNASYVSTKLQCEFYLSFLDSRVSDSTSSIITVRNNHGTNWRVFFNKSWFVLGATDFLQSDEQNLKIRTTLQLGMGKILLRNHQMYLNTAIGLASNTEKFQTDQEDDESLESFLQIDFNGFGFKDVDISSKFQLFPSLSKSKRLRYNYTFNIKYDLPLDLYLGVNLTLNYDNQPGEDISKYDYVFQSVFGWSF